jgi:hypothetical protein
MNRKSRTKEPAKSAASVLPGILIAALFGAAMTQYTEFVFFSATDTNGHTVDIPIWRVHMGSTCLGFVTFVIVLFSCEALRYRSRRLALQLALPWLPLAGLTGLATIIHIPSLIVIGVGVAYGIWVYLRSRTQQRVLDS